MMKSRIGRFLLAGGFVWSCLILGPRPAAAQIAVDFQLRDIEGRTVRLSDFRGKSVVLINFWATWCVPCVKEFPHFQRLFDRFKDKGFTILAITVDGPDTVAQVKPFLSRNQYSFPVLLDMESEVLAVYNPRIVLPYTLLVDQAGNVRYAHQGYSPGDEKELESELVRILEGPQSGEAKDFSFQASEAFLGRRFGDRDYVETNRGGKETQVINQIDLALTWKQWLAGARLDANADFSPWRSELSLAKRFVEVRTKSFAARAGDFYHSVGRGLAFSLLKTFEKEGLEYIIDTTIDGGKASWASRRFSAEAFGGWMSRRESDLRDAVAGGTFGWQVSDWGRLQAHVLGSWLKPGSSFGTKNVLMESLSFDAPSFQDKFKFYGEVLLLQKRKHYASGSVHGHGIYLESGVYLNALTILLEFKDYRNLDYEYSRPPLLESEQIPVLANQFVLSAANVSGVAARMDYALPGRRTIFFSRILFEKDHPSSYFRTVTHFFAGMEKKFSDTGWLNLLAGYRNEDATSFVYYYTAGRTLHGQANLSFAVTDRLSFEFDLEAKRFNGLHHDYSERRSFVSLHVSPRWVATFFWERTDDPEIMFFKNKKDWLGVQFEFKFLNAGALRLFYGSNKGGVKCAGGVCKFFPPFEGLRLDVLLRL